LIELHHHFKSYWWNYFTN